MLSIIITESFHSIQVDNKLIMSPVDDKKVPPDEPEGDERTNDKDSLLMNFAMETTAHGVVKIATARTKIKQVFWVIALVGAFVLSSIMIGLR